MASVSTKVGIAIAATGVIATQLGRQAFSRVPVCGPVTGSGERCRLSRARAQ